MVLFRKVLQGKMSQPDAFYDVLSFSGDKSFMIRKEVCDSFFL